MKVIKSVCLSIETAINGGSIAILENEKEIDYWVNDNLEGSKAENLLEQISHLLMNNKIKKEQIKLICVSVGAMSQTTEKITLAFAKGLSKSFNCQMVEVPILKALLLKVEKSFQGKILTAVQIRHNRICWQFTEKKDSMFFDTMPNPQVSLKTQFAEMMSLSDHELLISVGNEPDLKAVEKRTILVDRNTIAYLIGKTGLQIRVR